MSDNKESKKVNIEIDGRSYEALPNQTIIQIADANGIYIPRFCYHKKLSVAANCRMCLVDVEGARRASPACATPVMEGMKVKTRSEKALQMQKDVMEFLLINHPLDCPICDQGGECELQDIALGYGNTTSDYKETKRAVADPGLGPLISTDMTRCILCTRCVRFGEEVAGVKELGVMGRSDHSEISTYISGDVVNSELSGNVIDLCPVGALTSKPFRFKARAWELKQYPAISAGDGVATDLSAHVYQNKLVRVVPREDEAGNTWITDRDRFEYAGLYSEDRIQQPMIKKSGDWVPVSWEEALDFVKVAINQTVEKNGADKIAAIISENSTSEEMFLTKKLLKAVGSENIDSRVRENASKKGISSGLGLDCSLKEIEKSDFIFVLGSNLRKEYPLINYGVKEAVEKGAKVVAWNICDYEFNYPVAQTKMDLSDAGFLALSLLKALLTRANISYSHFNLDDVLRKVDPAAEVRKVADQILEANSPKILVGQDIVGSKEFDFVSVIISMIKEVIEIKGGFLPTNVNSVGAVRTGVIPGFDCDTEFSVKECLGGNVDTKLLLLINTEPAKDSVLGEAKLRESLSNIDIVISFGAYADKLIKEQADIIIPTASHYETSGSFVDAFGNIKKFKQVVKPYAENKELWRILRVLGNILDLKGFEYNEISEVTTDAYNSQQDNSRVEIDYKKVLKDLPLEEARDITFVATSNMYDNTSLVRRSKPLQETQDAKRYSGVRISRALADKIGSDNKEGRIKFYNIENSVEYDFVVDETLHSKNIMIPRKKMEPFLYSDSNISIRLVNDKGE